VFLQHKQKYKRVLSWLDKIVTQPTEYCVEEMAGRPGRGKSQAPKRKTALTPLEVEEDWDKEIEREETERARQEAKSSETEGRIRPEADSSDSNCGHSSEDLELDYEEESNEARDLRDSRYYASLKEKKMKKSRPGPQVKPPPPHLRRRSPRSQKKRLSASRPLEKADRQTGIVKNVSDTILLEVIVGQLAPEIEQLLAQVIEEQKLCHQKWWYQRGADTNLRRPRTRSQQPSVMCHTR
jgi:hypothetical protein